MLVRHIEIVDPDNDMVPASFEENSEPTRRIVVSPDGRLVVIKRRKTVEL